MDYNFKALDPSALCVKLQGAFSHMQDASGVHRVVLNSGVPCTVVHDDFGAHPNDINAVEAAYIDGLREDVSNSVLKDFSEDVLNSVGERFPVSVSKLTSGKLTPADIVGGLFY
jgi:hypothetical protein